MSNGCRVEAGKVNGTTSDDSHQGWSQRVGRAQRLVGRKSLQSGGRNFRSTIQYIVSTDESIECHEATSGFFDVSYLTKSTCFTRPSRSPFTRTVYPLERYVQRQRV